MELSVYKRRSNMGKVIKLTKRSVVNKPVSKEGNVNGSDAWLHQDVMDSPPEPIVKKGLHLNLQKSGNLNTSKLVRRPVQVRGKNGKVFTRMQWVDPTTGQPPEHRHTDHLENEEHHNHTSRDEYIKEHVKKMTRDEKYAHLDKHKIEWKRNDHPAIDHKNAVEALKNHLKANPHLIGADKLPEHVEKSPNGDSRIQDFINQYKKNPEKLYSIMKDLKLADEDPRLDPKKAPVDKGGDGTGAILHMRNMMALKKYLKANLHKLDEYSTHPEVGVSAPKKKDAPSPTKAQEGGNDIKTILSKMSAKELYALMKEQGITDEDPRLDPAKAPVQKGGDGTGAIMHMKNMMALKKAIVLNPSILNITPEGIDKPEEAERKATTTGDKLASDNVKAFLDGVSRETKLKWAHDYKDHKHMKNRITSEHEHVDSMHKIGALRKILLDNPELMHEGDMYEEHRKESLMNMKIKNKDLQKVLRKIVGISVGDVKQVEKGVEWEFNEGSFARVEEDDDGEPILSVVDTGKDGQEWNEHSIPLEEIKEFLEGATNSEPTLTVTPLHEKTIDEIYKALDKDYDKYMSPDIMNRLDKEMAKICENSFPDSISYIQAIMPSVQPLSDSSLQKYLSSKGVLKPNGKIDQFSHEWNKLTLGHLVEDKKTKHALDYIPTRMFAGNRMNYDRKVTWVLHESAKSWTPEERADARRELIHNAIEIHPDIDLGGESEDYVRQQLSQLIHNTLEFVPFDLLTDTLQAGAHQVGIEFTPRVESKGKDMLTCHYDRGDAKKIRIVPEYITALEHHDTTKDTNPYRKVILGGSEVTLPNGEKVVTVRSSFGNVMSHEFAHAIDDFLSGRELRGAMGEGRWSRNYEAVKYKAEHYVNDYNAKVNNSNPTRKLLYRKVIILTCST